jgi:hypothetical protein
MARQQDICWSCGAGWDDRTATQHARPLIHSGDAARPGGRDQRCAPAVIGQARAVAQATLDVDRWADEGGSVEEGSRRVGARVAVVQ